MRHHAPDPVDLGDLDLSGLSREDILSALIDAAIIGAPEEAEFSLFGEVLDFSAPTDASVPFADWDESKHPRGQPENKGEFGPGGGADPTPGRGGERARPAAVPREKRRPATKGPPPGDEVHDYVAAFNDPGAGKVTAEEVRTANGELESAGSRWRVVPKGSGEWVAASVRKLESNFGDDWSVEEDPITGRLELGNEGYFEERRGLVGDEESAAYVQGFNDPSGGDVTQAQVDTANQELEDAGSDYRIDWSDEHGLWVAVPADAPFYSPDQPRDERGRWSAGGNGGGMSREEHAARREASTQAVRDYLAATHQPTREETAALAGHLSTLTVKQLHELRKEHGLKDPRQLKADFVNSLHGYFKQHREGQAKAREEMRNRLEARHQPQPAPEQPEPHRALASAVAGKQGFTPPFASGPYHAVRHNPTGLHIEAESGTHSGRFAVVNPHTREVHSRHDTAEAAVAAVPLAGRTGTGQGTLDRELRDRAAQVGKGTEKAPAAGKADAGEHQARVEQEFNRLLPAARGGLVSIPELRQRLGLHPADFEHAVRELDNSDRLRLVAVGDRSRHTKEQLSRGIEGENETFMYVEPGPHHVGGKQRAGFSQDESDLGTPEETEDAAMSDLIPASVPFSADGSAEEEGRYVLKDAPVVFRAGRYDFPVDKGGPFEMTAEDIRAAVEAVPTDGVPISNEHNQRCFFQGKLGRFMPKAWADFGGFGGVVKLAKPVLDLVGDAPIKLSANFDRLTKRLKDVTLTHTPRITDAALFAAFSREAGFADGMKATPHGQAAMQMMHDMSAQHGAVCGVKKPDAGMSADAPFTSQHEHDGLQAIHDTTTSLGADCKLYDPEKDSDKSGAMRQVMAQYTADTAAPTAREKELEKRLAEQEARFNERVSALEKSRQEAAFSAALAGFTTDARAFVDEHKTRLYGKRDRDSVAAQYVQAARDDYEHPAEVHFSAADGTTQKGTRLAAFTASILARPETHLDVESIPGPLTALFAQDPKPEGMSAERRKELLQKSEHGRQLLRERERANGSANGSK